MSRGAVSARLHTWTHWVTTHRWVLLWGALAVLVAHHATWRSGWAETPGNAGDARYVHYMLEHGYRWLRRLPGHTSFFDAPFFYPQKGVGAYSELLLGSGLPYWLARLVGTAEDTAFEVWIVLTTALNVACAYAMLRVGLRFERLGSAAGAMVFACAAPRIHQIGHPQLLPHYWTCLALLGLIRAFALSSRSRERAKWLWLAGLSSAFQLWAGFYLGWFLVLGISLGLPLMLLSGHGRRALARILRENTLTVVLVGAAALAIIAPWARYALKASAEVGPRRFSEVLSMIPVPMSWLNMGQQSWLYGWLASSPSFASITMEHEQRLGLGALTTVAAIVGLLLGTKRRPVVLFGALALILWVLATQWKTQTLWTYVYQSFPAGQAIRAVSRIALLLTIPVAMGLASTVERLVRRGTAATVGAVVLIALCLTEQGVSGETFYKAELHADAARIAQGVDPKCPAFFYSPINGSRTVWKHQLDAMWASMLAHVPTINGYSGGNPPGWQLEQLVIRSPGDTERLQRALTQWTTTHGLSLAPECWVRMRPREVGDSASVVSVEIGSSVKAGASARVRLTLRNDGTTTWLPSEQYLLGNSSTDPTSLPTPARSVLAAPVTPGHIAVFFVDFEAPKVAGPYRGAFRMVHEHHKWFGETAEVTLTVVP